MPGELRWGGGWILGSVGEVVIGLWLVSGWKRRLASAVAALVFLLFSGVAFAKASGGTESCGCFGDLSVSPRLMLWLDVPAAFFLFLQWRCHRAEHRLGWPIARVLIVASASVAAVIYVRDMRSFLPMSEFEIPSTRDWVGGPFPIPVDRSVAKRLATGSWFVVVYRERCEHCQRVLPELEQLAASSGASVYDFAFVSLEGNPSSPWRPRRLDSPVLLGRIVEGARVPIVTPLVVRLRDGVVLAIWSGNDVDRLLIEFHSRMGRL